jgi:hypothetical protein
VAADEEKRPRIPSGDILSLFEKLGIQSGERDATRAAGAQLASYLSNRSVALLLRPEPGLWVGSGVCIRIGARHFVVTAKHNLQHNGQDLQISDIEVRARGEKYGEPLNVTSKSLASDLDLAWLELDPMASKRPHLAFVTIDEIASLPEKGDREPCCLLGYPAEMADKPSDAQQRPLLESAFILTLSIPQSRRQGHATDGTFAIEWPPHDGSLDDSLPQPYGLSGGGVWLLPRHDDYLVWSPERARLVGIEVAWRRDAKELVVIRIERWLELISNDFPEIRASVMRAIERIRRQS